MHSIQYTYSLQEFLSIYQLYDPSEIYSQAPKNSVAQAECILSLHVLEITSLILIPNAITTILLQEGDDTLHPSVSSLVDFFFTTIYFLAGFPAFPLNSNFISSRSSLTTLPHSSSSRKR